jgi:hypothetical protein
MVSVQSWKHHFANMAHGKIPVEDVYVLKQRGRGFGRDSFGKSVYRVRNSAALSGAPSPPVTIVSPVAQTLQQAKVLAKGTTGRSGKRKHSTSRGRSASNIKRSKKSKGKKSKKKKPKKKKPKKKKKQGKKKQKGGSKKKKAGSKKKKK